MQAGLAVRGGSARGDLLHERSGRRSMAPVPGQDVPGNDEPGDPVAGPVGEVVLIEGTGSTSREVGRVLVPAR